MNKRYIYTFEEDLEKRLKNPEFKKIWDAEEPDRILAGKMIEARLKKKMSQRDLALKVGTSQAAISRVESMNGNPSFDFLKRIANALGGKLQISI